MDEVTVRCDEAALAIVQNGLRMLLTEYGDVK